MAEPRFDFDTSERAALDRIGEQLRAAGWAQHVSVPRLLKTWIAVSWEVDSYTLTIDDYTNDLCARDGLEIALSAADVGLRTKLLAIVSQADRAFIARTVDDEGVAVGRHYRLQATSDWWWRRRPTAGPLADYLDSA